MIQVSFIIPAYNAEATIKLCLESILTQTFPRDLYEVIVVNNNSNDKTSEIVSTFPEVLTLNEKQQGRSYARNCGAKAARGEFLAFVDADVILHPQWLKSILKDFSDDIGASQGPIRPSRKMGSRSLNDYRYRAAQESTKGTFLLLSLDYKESPMINSAACLYRKAAFEKAGGFDTGLTRHEDIDLSKRVLLNGYNFAICLDAEAEVIFNGSGWLSYFMRSYEDGYYKRDYLLKWHHWLFSGEDIPGQSNLMMFIDEVLMNMMRSLMRWDSFYFFKAVNSSMKSMGRIMRTFVSPTIVPASINAVNEKGFVSLNGEPVIEFDMTKKIVKRLKVVK